jgi:hypothetical protein
MGEAFILRKGGGETVERTLIPSINFVTKTSSQIVVTFTNGESVEVEIYYGLTFPLTDVITLQGNTSSSNISFQNLEPETNNTISCFAIVTNPTLKKIKSEIVSTTILTNPSPFTAATGGTTFDYNSSGKRYRSHTFTENGDFVVTRVGETTDNRNQVHFLVIGGGGGGSADSAVSGAPGGAGGYRTSLGSTSGGVANEAPVEVVVQSYPVVVGAGGAATTGLVTGNNGNSSTVFQITSSGGGGGGRTYADSGGGSAAAIIARAAGKNGGSGGGASPIFNRTGIGGLGTTGQGRNGGNSGYGFRRFVIQGSAQYIIGWGAGGGGGAGGVGTDRINNDSVWNRGGNGGNGLANSLRTGSNETRAGGGGGRGNSTNGTAGSGGGGAANGAGVANTGGGGGNSAGGSGIVVIRYEIEPLS